MDPETTAGSCDRQPTVPAPASARASVRGIDTNPGGPPDRPATHLRPVEDPNRVATKRCPAGHPNNPSSDRCRICDASFDRATEVEDLPPRSPARLLLEDGTAIDLVTDLVIGRCPDRVDGVGPLEPPQDTLAVTGPQVSRRHLVVEVDGWQVTVRDQGSTNGTFLTRRGERGRRRVPDRESLPVRIGDTIHFGSRQALVVQSPTG